MSAIKRSTEVIGGQTALASAIGVTQSHVWNWINRKRRAPAKYIRQISLATNGQVTVKELLIDHEES